MIDILSSFFLFTIYLQSTNDQTLKKCRLHICADGENMLKYKNTGDNILSTREKRYNQKERDS